jgi:cytosine/adenosine deaminase-related metal-dependent hydrolase
LALVIAGNVVAMAPSDPAKVFRGRVWLGDDGLIDAVTPDKAPAPAGFEKAPVVDVKDAWVLPGLIDLHNHIAYNALPLWAEPAQKVAFRHHNSWTGAPTYQKDIGWPAGLLVSAEPEAVLAYVQLRALVGGTTAIQGWPTANRQHVQVLRDIDEEKAGSTNRNLIQTSALTLPLLALGKMAQAESAGGGFIYHCAEGQPGTVVAQEFTNVGNAGCLQKTFIAIHCNAITGDDWKRWAPREKAGAVVWSPFSNLWLYGKTTDIVSARRQGVTVCLGSDWGPSGTKHVLGELKVARLASDKLGMGLKDDELVAMVTSNPGDVLARCWSRPFGRLVPGAFPDITVFRPKGSGGVWSQVVAATEREVMLAVFDGKARYGDAALMSAAGASASSTLTIAGIKRRFAIPDPADATRAWSWADISGRLDGVRKDPAHAVKKADAIRRSYAGPMDDRKAPLELVLDMPGGGPQAALAMPKHPENVVVPPLPTLVHDKAFFKDIHGRGFHEGLLDGLAKFYE